MQAALDGTGLTGLPGSSANVSVVGFCTNGGFSWFSRPHAVARLPDLARLGEIKQRVDPSARWWGTSPYPDEVNPRTRRLVTSLVLVALVAIVVVAALVH
ncbi:hypothetical protein AB0E69_04910 [Kribbella sp. NPDC026611]|uniref:hypothetical protein n=1 Tax=Kribbella sp. NPDC026611 TaxID=3154911 RepID=UPI0033FF78B9